MRDTGRDPYVGLMLEMQNAARAPAGLSLGTVLAIGADSLRIRTDTGLELDRDDVLLNPMLRWDAEETCACTITDSNDIRLEINGDVACEIEVAGGTGTTVVDHMRLFTIAPGLSGKLSLKIKTRRLQAGDRVVLIPTADGQIYYVICKVVGI